MWKLWWDATGPNGLKSRGLVDDRAVSTFAELFGGMDGLTRAGARTAIDTLLVPVIAARES